MFHVSWHRLHAGVLNHFCSFVCNTFTIVHISEQKEKVRGGERERERE